MHSLDIFQGQSQWTPWTLSMGFSETVHGLPGHFPWMTVPILQPYKVHGHCSRNPWTFYKWVCAQKHYGMTCRCLFSTRKQISGVMMLCTLSKTGFIRLVVSTLHYCKVSKVDWEVFQLLYCFHIMTLVPNIKIEKSHRSRKGIRERPPSKRFLNGRTQLLQAHPSAQEHLKELCLEPLLFWVYINNLPCTVGSTAYLFTYDYLLTGLLIPSAMALQEDINQPQQWEWD